MPYVWLALTVLFVVVEAASVSMVSLWFAAGALVAMITGFCGGELWLQVLLFLAVSAVLLALLRPFAVRYLKPRISKTNVDAIVGAEGLVTEKVDTLKGVVKIGGMTWSARSTSGQEIPEKTRIVVDRIEGVKVFVTPVREESVID